MVARAAQDAAVCYAKPAGAGAGTEDAAGAGVAGSAAAAPVPAAAPCSSLLSHWYLWR